MNKRPIIIHVPKTGGTTLFMAISGSPKPPSPNMLYRHIEMKGENEEMKSNCGDIFNSETNSQYEDHKLVMMIRNPLDRIESEFGFLSNRRMFRDLWHNNVHTEFPKTLLEYIQHPSNANAISRFLLGLPMYTDDNVTLKQFNSIVSSFDKLPFVFGRTDQMGITVANVAQQCGIEFGDSLPRYRTSLYKPKRDDNWNTLATTFNELNSLDSMLVDEIYSRFEMQTQDIPRSKVVTFDGDEYDSLYPFICADSLRSPLEIYANDLEQPQTLYDWIEKNKATLEPTLKSCLENNNGDGKAFLVEWLEKSIPVLIDNQTFEIDKGNPLQSLRHLTEAICVH